MTSEPFQNPCQKCVVFEHRFFQVWASILGALGRPCWSQVGIVGPTKIRRHAPWSHLNWNVFQKLCLGGLQALFWRPRASILEGLEPIFSKFSIVCGFVFWKWSLEDKMPKMPGKPRNPFPERFEPKVGGRRCSSHGGFQSAWYWFASVGSKNNLSFFHVPWHEELKNVWFTTCYFTSVVYLVQLYCAAPFKLTTIILCTMWATFFRYFWGLWELYVLQWSMASSLLESLSSACRQT